MEFIKRHRRFLINTLIYIISFVVIVIPMDMWIYKGLNLYRLGKSAVYVFGIWFGVSAIIAAINYYENKDNKWFSAIASKRLWLFFSLEPHIYQVFFTTIIDWVIKLDSNKFYIKKQKKLKKIVNVHEKY